MEVSEIKSIELHAPHSFGAQWCLGNAMVYAKDETTNPRFKSIVLEIVNIDRFGIGTVRVKFEKDPRDIEDDIKKAAPRKERLW